MSTPTFKAQCASFLAQLPRWSAPVPDESSATFDDDAVLVLRAHACDSLFLTQLPYEEGVRLLRCVALEPIDELGDKLWTADDLGETEWRWLQDEWALNGASVMFHPSTGALAWVRDLTAKAPSTVGGKWQEEIQTWIAESDSLIDSMGWGHEPALPRAVAE